MSKKIAYGGILLSVNIIILMIANIIPINTLFIFGIASLPISIFIMKYGPLAGLTYYISLFILSFIVISNKIHWIFYILTFGIYGLIKYPIEKDRHIIIEYLLKFLFCNITMCVLWVITKGFIYININLIMIILFEVLFFIYDYMYSRFIDYFTTKYIKLKNY